MASPSVTLLRTQSDERLVALARAGHERAFEAIVERYRRPLLRQGRRYLPEARAEDALQQALISAWTALRRGDEVRELRPWLHRIVHNTSLNALRASGYDYEQLHDTLHGTGGPAELAERSALVRSTFAGLAALPERQRDALLQIAVEGRSQDEVAEELGLSQGAVRQLVHRARTSLRTVATAVTPLPLAGWLAAGGERADVAARVGELVAGAGGSATLAKAGAVAVLAGGAVSGPALVRHDDGARPAAARSAAVTAAPARAAAADDGTADQGSGDAPATPIAAPVRRGSGSGSGSGRHGGGGKGHSGPGRGGDDDSASGKRGGGDDDSGSGIRGGSDDRAGSGSGSDDGSGSGSSGSSAHDGTDDAHAGSGGEHSGTSEGSASSGGGAPAPLPGTGDGGSGSSGGSGVSGSGRGSDDWGSSHGGPDDAGDASDD